MSGAGRTSKEDEDVVPAPLRFYNPVVATKHLQNRCKCENRRSSGWVEVAWPGTAFSGHLQGFGRECLAISWVISMCFLILCL